MADRAKRRKLRRTRKGDREFRRRRGGEAADRVGGEV